MISVGQEFEVETLFSTELLVRIDAVETDSEHDGVMCREFRLVHLKLVGFPRSTRSLVFGIEIQDDPFATVIFQADRRAILRRKGEVGRGGAWHGH